MIMVDELRKINLTLFGWGWDKGCHLTTNGDAEELHQFAKKIGLRRQWFQDHNIHPHYDLNENKRLVALAEGALFVPGKEQAKKRMERLRA